jgi:hypothetical protein
MAMMANIRINTDPLPAGFTCQQRVGYAARYTA